ncbi:HigA family addiction module antidote protein [Kaustia mangrovi]|uniref:HigA family addiction module antidote protein n=1 Tax=Kaustia mangrovi TaxID=2593653 RepID=A0A7S8C852_9HYPH|nr:HigA family addiction module antitoxin [Kaustia mangrovi]QPC45056.1 HigA family addiction module antidote protein [Kaustia mangrovi]
MTEYRAIRDPNRQPAHPGEVLREDVLPALGKSKTEIAALLGISRQTLYDIMAERQPVTPAMAVRLAKLLGGSPGVWVRMQAAHDIWIAEREVDVSSIPTLTDNAA